MDPEAPRALGDLEDAEPKRRAPVPKKSLEQFLEEFEVRLRDHPGQAATSATAALEGRAEGVWRTPVEGAERVDRSLPHGVLSRQTPTMTPPGMPPPIVTAPAAAEPAPPATIEPAMVAEPSATVEPAIIVEAPAAADASEPEPVAPLEPAVPPAAPAQRRHRHRRHHRHR